MRNLMGFIQAVNTARWLNLTVDIVKNGSDTEMVLFPGENVPGMEINKTGDTVIKPNCMWYARKTIHDNSDLKAELFSLAGAACIRLGRVLKGRDLKKEEMLGDVTVYLLREVPIDDLDEAVDGVMTFFMGFMVDMLHERAYAFPEEMREVAP